jgi:shikimate kinase
LAGGSKGRMIIEFVGMAAVGKSTLISNVKLSIATDNIQQSSKESSTMGLIVKLFVFLLKANLQLKTSSIKKRIIINERLFLSGLKQIKHIKSKKAIKVIDEGIIHAILFSLDNRVIDKKVDYVSLLKEAQFLFRSEETVVVFVDANVETIMENREKRNRAHNEKTTNVSAISEERDRNAQKLAALEAISSLRYFYVNNSSQSKAEIRPLMQLINNKSKVEN